MAFLFHYLMRSYLVQYNRHPYHRRRRHEKRGQ
jgi:hypothetical protein